MKLKSITIKALSLCFLINSCSTDEELKNINSINNLQNLKTKNLSLQQNPPVLYDDLPTKEEDERSGKFLVQGNKWNTNNLTYYYKNGTPDIINNNERNGIREAFNLWTEVTPLTFTETLNPNADIIIAFEEGNHGDGSDNAFDGVGGVLAHAFSPPPNGGRLAGDMHFDESETWTISLRPSSLSPRDLITVTAHEIGHSLGLRHSDVPNALMYPFYGGSHRFLDADDILGIQSIYGAPTITPEDEYLVGDWNGDGRNNIAVRRGNEIIMDYNFDGTADRDFRFGFGDNRESQYLVGDWNGDGKDNIAVRRGNQIIMDFNFDGTADSDFRFGFGDSRESQYLVGDWNGDGRDNIAVRRGNQIIMDFNFDGTADSDFRFGFGDSRESQYLVGDWNGDGKDNIAVRRGNEIIMDFNFDGTADSDFRFGFGTE